MTAKISLRAVPVRQEELPRYLNEAFRDLEIFFNDFSTQFENEANVWGLISGTLTDQTDLVAAFDAKVSQAPFTGITYGQQDGSWVEVLDTEGGQQINGDLTVGGTLTVTGPQVILESNIVNIGDAIITLNSDLVGAPFENAGIEVNRGTELSVSLLWDEATDQWQATRDGITFNDLITAEGGQNIATSLSVAGSSVLTVANLTDDSVLDKTFQSKQGKENGFDNRTDSVLSFVDGTRTFTIAPATTSFTFYTAGIRFVKTSPDSIVIPDAEGMHFFYYDQSGVLQQTQVFTNAIITDFSFIALVYWDATNKTAITLAEERHGNTMDSATHLYNHETIGTRYGEGLQVGNILSDENGSLETHAQLSVSGGSIWDEDILIDILPLAAPASIPFLYKSGAAGNWRKVAANTYVVTTTGTGRAAWNEFTGGVWQLTEVGNQKLMLMHLYATNDVDDGFFWVMGEQEYNNVSEARDGAKAELITLGTDGLPVVEYKSIATVIIQSNNAYGNAVKSRIRTTDDGADFIDWRAIDVGAVANVLGATVTNAADVVFDPALAAQFDPLSVNVQLALGEVITGAGGQVIAGTLGVEDIVTLGEQGVVFAGGEINLWGGVVDETSPAIVSQDATGLHLGAPNELGRQQITFGIAGALSAKLAFGSQVDFLPGVTNNGRIGTASTTWREGHFGTVLQIGGEDVIHTGGGQTINGNLILNGTAGVGGDLTVDRGNGTGVVYFDNSGTEFIYYDGTKFLIQVTSGLVKIGANEVINSGGGQTIGGDLTATGTLKILSGNPVLRFQDSNAAADNQIINLNNIGGDLRFQALTDAGAGGGGIWEFRRTSNNITDLVGAYAGTDRITLANDTGKLTLACTTTVPITATGATASIIDSVGETSYGAFRTVGTAGYVFFADGTGTHSRITTSRASGMALSVDNGATAHFQITSAANTSNGLLVVGGTSVSGNEGGQINFTQAPNSSGGTSFVIDQFIDSFRFFTYNASGLNIFYLSPPAGTGSYNLLHSGGGQTITESLNISSAQPYLLLTETDVGNDGVSKVLAANGDVYLQCPSATGGGTAGNVRLSAASSNNASDYQVRVAGGWESLIHSGGGQTIKDATAATVLTLDAVTGQDARLRFQENAIDRTLFYNDSSIGGTRLLTYSAAGASEMDMRIISGVMNVVGGNIEVGGNRVIHAGGGQSIAGTLGVTNTLTVSNTTAAGVRLSFNATDGALNEKNWQVLTQNGVMVFRAYSDTSGSTDALLCQRVGNQVTVPKINNGANSMQDIIHAGGGQTISGALTLTGNINADTIQFTGDQAEWRWGYNSSSTGTEWKTFANVTIGTALFAAVTFKVELLIGNNFGASGSDKTYIYYVTCYRSGGVLNNSDTGWVVGPNDTYLRLRKVSVGVYEIQVTAAGNHLGVGIKIKPNQVYSDYTVSYTRVTAGSPVAGTSGVLYYASDLVGSHVLNLPQLQTNLLEVGDYSGTTTGAEIRLNAQTAANQRSTLKCTNGNLHIDAAGGFPLYLNYYTGSTIYFGKGSSGVHTAFSTSGTLYPLVNNTGQIGGSGNIWGEGYFRNMRVSGDVFLSDGADLYIGSGNDFRIWHDFNNGNTVIENNQGNLYYDTPVSRAHVWQVNGVSELVLDNNQLYPDGTLDLGTSGKPFEVIWCNNNMVFYERITPPGTPGPGTINMYAKSNGRLYYKNDAGTEFLIG